jgi:hypothetical protein
MEITPLLVILILQNRLDKLRQVFGHTLAGKMMRLKVLFLSLLAVVSYAKADVINAPTQKITSLRVEGSVAFVGFGTPFAETTGCAGSRIWIDLNDPIGRFKYGTAMLAYSTSKKVTIRANADAQKVFNAYRIYDIVVFD